ncbi:bifunctional ADP-dependent NAD(P)H-hydrate dehydratase/NAD(P)H-hydrate epimerase [Calidifontibacter sp. DB0510]|uniref:ADP-dependent (S)-NAD(P)H-hydrate dehydratase n=1 Tax=Metallococcus carri TaxID=1656884 RepID=A0A967EFI5_9MICO|nr:bifunctional ADP-dependent NAD(P)H-hydrate dehydratase/NAD(P)H-hydrate epimerase [Metallococcus carri]NHN56656.1 bifunctional ADP-dependent NAD(P)H-hydrate dehydratase/NAD(P)H-hydrate epimerase [Metallococcus carri]NOP38955.1 bifunctional ADP-dependent NAD(P)H-hydrate dehydratase/NAD(P)H-hydrate epimerase [Calidifontibacter sp. DB2511S]
MMRAYAVPAVRAAEAAAMEGLEEGELMQRAARGLAEVALTRLEERGDRVVVLAGSGDNGGDALWAGAHLATSDANVVVVLVGSREHTAGLSAAREAGAVVLEWRSGSAADSVRSALAEADVVLDGIVGIGGSPGLPDHLRELPDLIGDEAYLIAVDLPSGCDPAGLVGADSIFADETVTFSLLKPCHLMPATEPAVGLLTVVDIGVAEPSSTPAVERLTHDDVADLWPVPGPADDKYSRGVLGSITGSSAFTGAALLSLTAAVTAGAGMVRYVGPDHPAELLRAAVPEAVFGDGRCQAYVFGSGWSAEDADETQLSVAREQLAGDLPMVIDAGGLDLLSAPRSAPTLLTPHAGELKRLIERLDLDEPAGVAGAQAVADHLSVTVLLKGAVTAVVSPSAYGQPVRTQADAPAWLGTAGSGDVLGGLAGMLLAAGLEPGVAGALAALVHGAAGRRANPGGPVRALDVAHALGPTIAALLTARPRSQ